MQANPVPVGKKTKATPKPKPKTKRAAPPLVPARSKRSKRLTAQHAEELLVNQALLEAEGDAEERQKWKRSREIIKLDSDMLKMSSSTSLPLKSRTSSTW